MKYYVRSHTHYRSNNPKPGNNHESFLVLTSDNWNDYGYETTFYIDFFDKGVYKELGLIRILKKGLEITRSDFPKEFNSLTSEYISLGYNRDFYESLLRVFNKQEALNILNELNDISVNNLDKNIHFDINDEGIQQSFFRSSDARYLYEEVLNIYFEDQKSTDRDYKFIYKFKKDIDNYIDINIDFSQYNQLPNRLFALIGKNGVGKTRFLNQLSQSLYDSSNPQNKNRFIINGEFQVPTYQKVIAISFSVFDNFFKGENHLEELGQEQGETKKANYTYIGLHKVDSSVYCLREISDTNIATFQKLVERNREKRFIELLNKSRILHKNIDTIDESFFKEYYSSGQSIFISMLCRLLLEIEDGSLIFLDEPELYLHPNAIASLMNIFFELLEDYQSYAILCTHSPILVQEIPSRYVRNLSLIENDIVQTRASIETFGANISDITKDIFNVTENESLYKSTLINLSKELDEEQIEALFSNALSLKARMFLSSLFIEEE
ncbi:ATP-binding protein [Bacillus safensis]|uniref:ATP-binding protein n=1 Tax=Bacillus safensis TaxID=561879 RepID=UPI0021B45E30|nr:ATP-binding protein [Bacillus safensis]MCZ2736974.1 ATP-binding protein [Bacillus safensis]MED1577417.1 ATP-binding protein [Bacillus safensis]UXC31882.1 ATP-binding protein [Bacillus safensis]